MFLAICVNIFDKIMENYKRQKMDFLDSLQPNDFRNGGSFNQAEIIIDKLNEGLYKAVINKKDGDEFINKAAENLFRNDSPAIEKAINLSKAYLKMKLKDISV
jgi:hypothetical protein